VEQELEEGLVFGGVIVDEVFVGLTHHGGGVEVFVHNHAAEYKTFFQLLLDEANYPLLFHCSAGKDRAGFGSYLLLTALDVDADTRLEEYLLSNFYLQHTSEADIKKAAQFYGLDQDKLRQLMNVKPAYLRGATDAIEAEYGSVKDFLCQALGVCGPEIDRLKQLMLYDYQATFTTERDSLGIELPNNATGYSVEPTLEGAPNFRSFNVTTGDGPRLRPNRIFRSDALHELTNKDLGTLNRLGVRTVIDFRHQLELDEDPDRLPRSVQNYLNPAITRNTDGAEELLDSTQYLTLRRGFMEGRYAEVDSMIRNLDVDLDARRLERYASFALDFTDSYGDFMRALAEPDNYPVVYHCQGGKDRAGFASAILLKTLGFDDQEVINDFLTTNLHAYDQQRVYYQSGIRSLGPVLSAHSAHLRYALRVIDQRYGSFPAYLAEGLGLTEGEIAAIRDNLLAG
ncbi:MAG: tyrosine-protein phosphatase, partial [Bacteroidota bacterium]